MARSPIKETAPQQPIQRKAGSLKPLLWVFMITLVMVAAPASIILFLIGLLPTIVAFFIDKSAKKYSAFCVGAMNITGVLPAWWKLFWTGQHTVNEAIQIITDVFDLIIMYAAATFGWLLYIAIPPVVSALLAVVAQHRIAQLRSRQRDLIKEWGEGIAARPAEQVIGSDGDQEVPPPPPASDIEELDAIPPAPS